MMMKIGGIVFFIAVVLCAVSALNVSNVSEFNGTEIKGGRCGRNLMWIVTELEKNVTGPNHLLTITGTGRMISFSNSVVPWSSFTRSIVSIELRDGVESISDNAFANSTELLSVRIAPTVEFIETAAFSGCEKLRSITIPASVREIGSHCFARCINLRNVTYLGVNDPGDSTVFDSDEKLSNVCVSIRYEDKKFCHKEIDIEDARMNPSLVDQDNHCFEVVVCDDGYHVQKRENATLWEEAADECSVYICDNDTGMVAKNKCGRSSCLKGVCQSQEISIDPSHKVTINVEGKNKTSFSRDKVVEVISTLTGINGNDMTVEAQLSDDGSSWYIVVYLSNGGDVDIIVTTMNEMESNGTCVFGDDCQTETVGSRTLNGAQMSNIPELLSVLIIALIMAFVSLSN